MDGIDNFDLVPRFVPVSGQIKQADFLHRDVWNKVSGSMWSDAGERASAAVSEAVP